MTAGTGAGTDGGRARGVMGMAATGLIGGGAAFLVSWLDPFPGDVDPLSDDNVSEVPRSASVILTLDPLVVSLTGTDGARRRAPRLRVVIALEVDEATAGGTAADDPRLRDGLTAAARALGAEALSGPDGLEALRAAALERARTILSEEAVRAVLVTDYVMT